MGVLDQRGRFLVDSGGTLRELMVSPLQRVGRWGARLEIRQSLAPYLYVMRKMLQKDTAEKERLRMMDGVTRSMARTMDSPTPVE